MNEKENKYRMLITFIYFSWEWTDVYCVAILAHMALALRQNIDF